ncbi:MAG: aminotransferase class V-fold PLP-dependent enzyme, partial [Porticoccaceae bacterium]|nr:aminotransferase class V-fold PLP-dependent enzyme [Porticoccaceae bacterium]
HEKQLTHYMHQQLQQLPEIELLSNADNNVGIATFATSADSAMQAVDLAHWLDHSDIAVRAGRHCAMPLMELRSRHSTSVRASVAAYNDRDDIDRMVEALGACLEQAGGGIRSVIPVVAGNDSLEGLSVDQLKQQRGWQQRYRQLLKWGDAIGAKPAIRHEGNRVHGCEAATWVSHQHVAGRHHFLIDSEARVVKGLAALLLLLINHKSSAEIAAVELDTLFAELGLEKHLSPSRNNGFRALVARVLQLADIF